MKNYCIYRCFIIILFFTISCCKDHDNNDTGVYPTFTEDELRWIYFTGDNFRLEDTDLRYKVNNTDTITVHVSSSHYHTDSEGYKYSAVGYGIINFDGINSFILQVFSKILKNPDNSFFVDKIFVDSYGRTWLFKIENANIDTAKINNKLYNEVYKFNNIPNDSTDLKTIFFAKSYGFLKVEFNNGNKITLIP